MNALLWKEFRQNRRFLAAAAAVLLLPYVLVLGMTGMFAVQGQVGIAESEWIQGLRAASMASIFFAVLLAAFVGGNAIAGERVDRSAEFAYSLPIPRRSAIAAKAVLAGVSCLVLWGVNVSVLCGAALVLNDELAHRTREIVVITAILSLLTFGVAWLFSSFSSSAVIAAAFGMSAAMLAALAIAVVGPKGADRVSWLVGPCLVIGIGCFIAGMVYCLRRLEP